MHAANQTGVFACEHLSMSISRSAYFKCLSHVNWLEHIQVKVVTHTGQWGVFENEHCHSPHAVLGAPTRSDVTDIREVWGAKRKGSRSMRVLARFHADISRITEV